MCIIQVVILIYGSNFMKVIACTYNLHITVKHHLGAQGQSHKFLTAPVYVNQLVSQVLVGLCHLRQSQMSC